MVKEMKKITYSQRSKLGAKALNSDPAKKSAAAKKAAETRIAKNPNCFVEMGRLKKKK